MDKRYLYKILDFSAYDGDSVNLTLEADIGFDMTVRIFKKARLYGIDTTELRDKRPDWKSLGYHARNYVRSWMDRALENPDAALYFQSLNYTGKFGRALGDILEIGDTFSTSLCENLIEYRLAVPYEGQNKADIEKAHLINISYHKEHGILR